MNEPDPQLGAAGRDPRRRWLGLAMLSLGVAMIIVDATIVNVAIPSIVRDLHLSGTTAEWVNTTYALVFAALLVTLGRIGDGLGRRRMYVAGLVLFLAASVLAGLAPTGETLVGARVLQGLGGAAILPATQSILNSNFRGRDRAIAFGIWGSVIGGVAALGPLLGGFLTTALSWRWAFFVNVPWGILAIAGTLAWVDESRDESARRGFDLPGFLLVTGGLSAVVFGLIEGYSYGWTAPSRPFELLGWRWPLESISVIPVAFAFGLLALGAFALVELRRERAGSFYLFDFGLWRYPSFGLGNLAGTIVSLGEFGLLFVLPLFLQGVLGLSAFDTGLTLLPLALGAFVAAPAAAGLARRNGPRRVVTLGMGLEAVGIVATGALLGRDLDVLLLAPPLFVYGLGVGFATAQLTSVVLGDVPPEVSGLASGTNSMLRQIGSALGIAILGTILFASLGSGTRDRLGQVPGLPPQAAAAIAGSIDASAGQALTGYRADPAAAPVVPAIEDAFVEAGRAAAFAGAAFVGLGLLLSLLLPKRAQPALDATVASGRAEAPGGLEPTGRRNA